MGCLNVIDTVCSKRGKMLGLVLNGRQEGCMSWVDTDFKQRGKCWGLVLNDRQGGILWVDTNLK